MVATPCVFKGGYDLSIFPNPQPFALVRIVNLIATVIDTFQANIVYSIGTPRCLLNGFSKKFLNKKK